MTKVTLVSGSLTDDGFRLKKGDREFQAKYEATFGWEGWGKKKRKIRYPNGSIRVDLGGGRSFVAFGLEEAKTRLATLDTLTKNPTSESKAIYLIKARWDRASYYWQTAYDMMDKEGAFTGALRNASSFPSVAAANAEIKRIKPRHTTWDEIRVIRLDEAQRNPKRKVTRVKRNPTFGKRKRVGMKHRDQKRIPMAIEVNTMASSLGLRSKSLDELIAMYNKHRKMRGSFIAKVIAEAAKQVAITKGAKIVRK